MYRSLQSLCLLIAGIFFQLCSAAPGYHAPPWYPQYVLVATARNVTINCQSRYSTVVNGSSPGPTVYLKENQTTWIRVYNNMSDQNFTMHWHGLTQRTAPFSDGTPLVSQWPIGPYNFFDYEIHPEIGDAGTYFYHSHVGFQAITAHGALIVEDANDPPYEYENDETITLSDFYAKNDSIIVDGLLAKPFKWSGEPDAIGLNGQTGNASFTNATDDSCKPHVLTVKPGETYRLRFVGRTALSLVTLGLEDHDNLTIIEADGQYTKPYTTDHLQLGTGQRFSVLFTAKSTSEIAATGNKTQYWIRYESRARPTNVTGYALLQYDMSADGSNDTAAASLPSTLPSTPPVILSNTINDWLEYSLSPLTVDPANPFPHLSEVTRTVYITMSQQVVDGNYTNATVTGELEWAQNGDIWQETFLQDTSLAPYLVNLYATNQTPSYTAALANGNRGWDPTSKTFPALVGEVLDIVWLSNSGPSGGWDIHPLHAHGTHYWDLGSGNGSIGTGYDPVANEARFTRGVVNGSYVGGYVPAKRDTTVLYRYATAGVPETTAGWRAWRVRITEADVGAWMMHCHILQHMVMGMQTVWVFGNATQILSRFPREPYVQGYLYFGGDAYGNSTYDPFENYRNSTYDPLVEDPDGNITDDAFAGERYAVGGK